MQGTPLQSFQAGSRATQSVLCLVKPLSSPRRQSVPRRDYPSQGGSIGSEATAALATARDSYRKKESPVPFSGGVSDAEPPKLAVLSSANPVCADVKISRSAEIRCGVWTACVLLCVLLCEQAMYWRPSLDRLLEPFVRLVDGPACRQS